MTKTLLKNLKCMRLVTLLLLLAIAAGAKAQKNLTVFDGSGTCVVLPMDINDYNYSTKSQYVIPSKNLTNMVGGTISSITYYTKTCINYTTDTDVKVYLKEVKYTKFSTAKYETVTDDNLVYKGKISVQKSGKTGIVVITLDKPYKYMGVNGGNLLISTENTEKQKDGEYIQFLGLAKQSDGVGVSGTDVKVAGTIVPSKKNFLPKTTFTYSFVPEISKVETAPNSATVTWTGKCDSYLLRYAKVESVDDITKNPDKLSWTEVKDAKSPCVIDKLNGGTYGVQVKGVYSDSEGTAWATANFTIEDNPVPCDVTVTSTTAHSAALSWKGFGDSYEVHYRKGATHIVMFQGFENGYDGWTLQNCHSKTAPNRNSSAVHTGNIGFVFYNDNVTAPQYLISPRIPDTTDGTKLLFYYKNYNTLFTESFEVGYSTTTNDINAFEFKDVRSIQNNQWTAFEATIPNDTKYICIKCTSEDKHYLFIDDIVVYKSSAEGDWQTIGGITGTSATITGLQADTEYEFQVRSVKTSKAGDGASEWAELKGFRTLLESVTLHDNDAGLTAEAKNAALISSYHEKTVNVTLDGHTFYKDGHWNTICLPFDVTISGSPLDGATARELTSASLVSGILTLTFGNAVTTLQAGKPYIIKWDNDGSANIVSPVFSGVVIDKTVRSFDNGVSGEGRVCFVGQYAPFEILENNAVLSENQGHLDEIIILTANDKIGYSNNTRTITNGKALHCFGAHFYVPVTNGKASTRSINLNTGDGTTGISATLVEQDGNDHGNAKREGWYSLSGQRIDQPTKKGVYIHNGKTVIIK